MSEELKPLQPARCGLCDSADLSLLYPNIVVADGEPRNIPTLRSLLACSRCHAYWTTLPPFVGSPEYYLEKPDSDHLLLENAIQRFHRVRQATEDALGRSGNYRLLDVGCATGSHFDVYGDSVDKFGIEAALSAVPTLQRRRATWLGPSIEDAPTASFDVVTSLDVIEHLERPRPFLDGLDRCLVPGGVVAVVTGNIDSLSARWSGRRWLYYALPEHCSFYSVESLRRFWEGERGYELVARTWIANQDINLPYIGRFVLGLARETSLKLMRPARVRALELSGRGYFPFFCDNMLVAFRKPLR